LVAACTAGPAAVGNGIPVPPVNGSSPNVLLDCRALKNLLPKDLATGVRLRGATPLSDTTAAWGDPPITLRCGVPGGSALDDPYTFNGVLWAQHDTGASNTWTTRGRKVNVAVQVPDHYDGQAELIGSLARAVKAALR
jgi:hypothetical protein